MKKALSKLFTFLGKALSEDNKNPSSTRIQNFVVIIILIPCIAFTLIYVTVKYESLIVAVLTAILGFVTAAMGIKVWQKGKEHPTEAEKIEG